LKVNDEKRVKGHWGTNTPQSSEKGLWSSPAKNDPKKQENPSELPLKGGYSVWSRVTANETQKTNPPRRGNLGMESSKTK